MPPDWIDVCAADGLSDNALLSAEVDGYAIIVARCGDTFHAVEDRCTHDDGPLADGTVEDCRITCPRHGAQFCLRTGDALSPPAYEPVRTFNVRQANGRILVEVPE